MKDDDCAGDLGFAADDDLEGKYDADEDLEGDCVDDEEEIHLSNNRLQSLLHTASHRHLSFPHHCHLHHDLHDLDVDLHDDLHDDDQNRHLDFHDNGDWCAVSLCYLRQGNLWPLAASVCLPKCISNPNKIIFPLSQKCLETDSQTQASSPF